MINPSYTWVYLSWPKDLDETQVTAWLLAISGQSGSRGIRFRIIARAGGIHHYLLLPSKHYSALSQSLITFLPELETKEIDPIELSAINYQHGKLTMSNNQRQLSINNPIVTNHTILSSLSNLDKDESIVINLSLGSRIAPRFVPNTIESNYIWPERLLEHLVYPLGDPKPTEAQILKAVKDKASLTGWKSQVVISVYSRSTERRVKLLNQVVGAFRASESPGIHLGYRKTFKPRYQPIIWPLWLNVAEVNTLLGWPLGDRLIPGIERIRSRTMLPSLTIASYGKIIATSPNDRNLAISKQDSLMHTHIVGSTGVGKSTLILNMVTQDINSGSGVLVIDPKGDLINSILERIPDDRRDDVVVLDPTDSTRPVGLNPMSNKDRPVNLMADDIISIFRGLYGGYFGPRTQDILHAGLLTIGSVPNMSLAMLPLLYTNPAFRKRLVSKLGDPLGLGSFWDWFDSISEAERSTTLAPVMNKLRAFLMRPAIVHVIGQATPRFDVSEVFTKNKILLVNLAKGQIGSESARLLGSFVVSQAWQAIQSRSAIPEERRKSAYVYIDEVQDYLNLPTDIGDVLAQSRGYKVGMILAHQHLGQLPPDLKAGVLANARSRICFQLSHDDAKVMARSGNGLTPGDFENLSQYHVYAKLLAKGESTNWVSGSTLEPPKIISSPDTVRALSRETYGQDVNEIDQAINDQITGSKSVLKAGLIGAKPLPGAEL